jgi:hypothetical protein
LQRNNLRYLCGAQHFMQMLCFAEKSMHVACAHWGGPSQGGAPAWVSRLSAHTGAKAIRTQVPGPAPHFGENLPGWRVMSPLSLHIHVAPCSRHLLPQASASASALSTLPRPQRTCQPPATRDLPWRVALTPSVHTACPTNTVKPPQIFMWALRLPCYAKNPEDKVEKGWRRLYDQISG